MTDTKRTVIAVIKRGREKLFSNGIKEPMYFARIPAAMFPVGTRLDILRGDLHYDEGIVELFEGKIYIAGLKKLNTIVEIDKVSRRSKLPLYEEITAENLADSDIVRIFYPNDRVRSSVRKDPKLWRRHR